MRRSIPLFGWLRPIISSRRSTPYYEHLLGVTRGGEWDPWLIFILRGVEETAIWTNQKIASIRRLAGDTAAFVRSRVPKIYSRELVDVIFEQPYCRIANVVEAEIVGRQAASRYLKALTSIGVLSEYSVGREKLFIHPKLLKLLTSDTHQFIPYE